MESMDSSESFHLGAQRRRSIKVRKSLYGDESDGLAQEISRLEEHVDLLAMENMDLRGRVQEMTDTQEESKRFDEELRAMLENEMHLMEEKDVEVERLKRELNTALPELRMAKKEVIALSAEVESLQNRLEDFENAQRNGSSFLKTSTVSDLTSSFDNRGTLNSRIDYNSDLIEINKNLEREVDELHELLTRAREEKEVDARKVRNLWGQMLKKQDPGTKNQLSRSWTVQGHVAFERGISEKRRNSHSGDMTTAWIKPVSKECDHKEAANKDSDIMIATLQREKESLAHEITELLAAMEVTNAKLADLNEPTNEDLKKTLGEFTAKIDTIQGENNKLTAEINELLVAMEGMEAKQRAAIEATNVNHESLEKTLAKKIECLECEKETLGDEIDQLLLAVDGMKEEFEGSHAELQSLRLEKKTLRDKIIDLEQEGKRLKDAITVAPISQDCATSVVSGELEPTSPHVFSLFEDDTPKSGPQVFSLCGDDTPQRSPQQPSTKEVGTSMTPRTSLNGEAPVRRRLKVRLKVGPSTSRSSVRRLYQKF